MIAPYVVFHEDFFSFSKDTFRARENQSLFNLKKFHFLVATTVDLHIIAMSSLHFLLGAGKIIM